MKVKRFFAPDMSTAMRTVREEVGPDAVILSNNSVAGGVEVIVALDYVDGPQVPVKSINQPRKKTSQPISSAAVKKALVGQKKPVRTAEDLQRARERMSAQAAKKSAQELMQSKTKDNQLNFDDHVWDDVLAALGKDDRISSPTSVASPLLEAEIDRALATESRSIGPSAQKLRQRMALEEDRLQSEPVSQQKKPQPDDQVLQSMREEIDELKALLRNRLRAVPDTAVESAPKPVAANPVTERLSQQFARMNVQPGLTAKLLQGIEADQSVDKGWKVALRRLSDAIPAVGEDITERGGILAFVGATGVGKTTTIGKLATRYVLRHGSAGIALVTTDCYRIAAHEQLKTFGRILDVPVRVVDENNSLDATLQSLRDKRLILIDTSGLSSTASVYKEQLSMLSETSYRIKKIMVLPSTAQYRALEASYRKFKPLGLNAVILTKVDEAVSLGEVTSLVAEQRLPLAYLTDGQKIPDDLEVARANALVSRAVMLSEQMSREQEAEAEIDTLDIEIASKRVG